MNDPIIRIDRITLTDMKSVGYGEIDFLAKETALFEQPSIMGIYGQNASGKTSVVETINLLRDLIAGERISRRCLDYITCGKDRCKLEIAFSIVTMDEQTNCTVTYQCTLAKMLDPNRDGVTIICVPDESLKISGRVDGESYVLQSIAETDENEPLIRPEFKRRLLFGSEKKITDEIRLEKALALRESRSFLFSNAVLSKIQENNETAHYRLVLSWIRLFVTEKLFVVFERDFGAQRMSFSNRDTKKLGFIDGIPLWLVHENSDFGVYGCMTIPLQGFAYVPKTGYDLLRMTVEEINPVLASLVPGLNIAVNTIGEQSGEDGQPEYQIELFSYREGCGKFPLRLESQGVRKIVSILSLLIGVHNNPQVCLVVDELDAGVFEYLLGELMQTMEDSGKGQLIFTSHNLRPLEKLNWKSICFTTNNPQNRFTKLKAKQSNNLRDVYYRNIGLGTDDVQLYDGASRYELGYAFRKAGRKE